jgi:hypothetical protein
MALTISDIPENLIEILDWPFDFAVNDIPEDPLWFSTKPAKSLRPIAGEGTGGVYSIINGTEEIIFVDSEGSGSIVAPNLESLMLIFACHPYWRDLLKFSGSGLLEEMRRTLPFAEYDYFKDQPEVKKLSSVLRMELRLGDTIDMVEVLYYSVSTSEKKLQLFAPDGWKLDSLFNNFTAMDNPTWRKRAEQ